MSKNDNNLDEFIEELLKKDFKTEEREAEVLRKVVTSREEKQLWRKTLEWTRQCKFFGNVRSIRLLKLATESFRTRGTRD